MERLRLTNKDEMEKAVEEAVRVLNAGGVVLYPTDTLYGLGADATNEEAISKVYAIKEREKEKPLSVMVASLEEMERYASVSKLGEKIMRKVLPGPFTFVLPKKAALPETLTGGEDTLGLRVPNAAFCIALAHTFRKAITATSANTSGQADGRNVDDILKQLGDSARHIDLILDAGELPKRDASTVLKVTEHGVKVLREGNRNHPALLSVLQPED